MKATTYIVDRFTLSIRREIQDYGNPNYAIERCCKLLVEVDATTLTMDNVLWKKHGIPIKSVIIYDQDLDWAFLVTNTSLERKMGPYPIIEGKIVQILV